MSWVTNAVCFIDPNQLGVAIYPPHNLYSCPPSIAISCPVSISGADRAKREQRRLSDPVKQIARGFMCRGGRLQRQAPYRQETGGISVNVGPGEMELMRMPALAY